MPRHEDELLEEIVRELRVQTLVLRQGFEGISRQSFIQFHAIRHELRLILFELNKIRHELQPEQLTRSVAVQFTGDVLMADNVLVLNVGDTSTASIQPFLADGVTPSGGALSNVSYTFSDPSATVVLNPDGLTALVTGVADSAGAAISGSASCTVTDTDGVVSQWTQAFTIQTNAVIVPPQQLTQSVAVQFTTPAPAGGATPTPTATRVTLGTAPVKDHRL